MKTLKKFPASANELLGSGAMAGSAFPTKELSRPKLLVLKILAPIVDAVSHRDLALELTSSLSIIAATLSRYAEDLSTGAQRIWIFNFARCLQQRSSHDASEEEPWNLYEPWPYDRTTALFTLVKGAPLSYSRDLQEDKEPVFDSVKTIKVL